MNVLTIEQSKAAYWADFAFYGTTIMVLAVVLVVGTPQAQWPRLVLGHHGSGRLERARVPGASLPLSWRAALSTLACRTSCASDGLHLRAHGRHGVGTRCVPLFTRLVDGRRLECLRTDGWRVVRLRCLRHHPPCHSPLACKERMAATASALAFHPP